MKYRTFGKLNLRISALGFGCMRFAGKEVDGKQVVDEDLAIRLIHTAIDAGVNYFDTAYMYLGGESEKIVGRALQGGYREKVYLATKMPCGMVKEPADLQRIFDEQLAKLQVDHVDFYLMHGLNAESWEKMKSFGAREFFTGLKAQGKIKYACFSFHDNTAAFKKIIDEYDWDMAQIQYNFMDIENQAGLEGVRYAGERGIPIVIMEGLLGGKLAKAPTNVQALYDAFPVKRSPVEWAFRFLLDHPEVGTILSGMNAMDQLRENLRIFDASEPNCMDEAEKALIADVRAAYKARTVVPCTGCAYCQPCPQGVVIPRIFSAWNNASLYDLPIKGNGDYKRIVANGGDASLCVACGLCSKACPQQMDVPQLLQDARAAME